MSKPIQAVILGEDLQQRVFVRRMLTLLGYPRNRIHEVPLPSGAGAGEAHVRRAFADDVREHRRRAARTRAVLVVMIDADTGTVKHRREQLALALTDGQIEPRHPDEPIALLIPRRNVETWVWHLLGRTVDEEKAHAKLTGRESDCQPAITRFVALRADPTSATGLPSLDEGVIESRRLP